MTDILFSYICTAMGHKTADTNYIHATNEGRMYIKSSDFFKQEKVIELLAKLEDSSIYKELESRKKQELEPA